MPIAEVTATVTIAANVVKALGKLGAYAEKQRNAEINGAIIEVQSLVMQLQEQLLRDRAAHDDLKRQHRELEESVRTRRDAFEWRENVFWEKATGAGPYCPKCFQEPQIPRVARLAEDRDGLWYCAVCTFATNSPELDRRLAEAAAAPRKPRPHEDWLSR